jgi:hypothetical protein
MKLNCVWEHNGSDSLLYAADYPGAFTRGPSREEAVEKMPSEIASYFHWFRLPAAMAVEVVISQEKESDLAICDADSDVLFQTEYAPLTLKEYEALKGLALKSAGDFQKLYDAIPDKDRSNLPPRETFYGKVPCTAREMYEHTKNVNAYYFGEINVPVDNEGAILECRQRGFAVLEQLPDFMNNDLFDGSYGEQWTLRKVLRRFIWHDRIHAKAMYRMAVQTFGVDSVPNIFGFQ